MAALEIILAFLSCIGLLGLGWLLFGRALLPEGGARAWAVLPARGDGADLEQAVKSLLWLKAGGLWQGGVIMADCGLTPEGWAVAQALASREPGVILCRLEEVKSCIGG